MDSYLEHFCDYLREKIGNDLAGVIIYGSYVKGYFDPVRSDYDVFVLFKSDVINIQEEIKAKFPKISLQLYMNLADFEKKIRDGGWNTFIAFIYTGKILYQTVELAALKRKLENYKPDFKSLNQSQKTDLINRLKADTEVGKQREGYELNKFFYASLLRKLQILYYIRTGRIVLSFNGLIEGIGDKFIAENIGWLRLVEREVFSRSSSLASTKEKYLAILNKIDNLIRLSFYHSNSTPI